MTDLGPLFHAPSRPRRMTQCEAILSRLEQGPASSLELEALVRMGYRQRVSELRKRGHRIECKSDPTRPGVNVYRLVVGDKPWIGRYVRAPLMERFMEKTERHESGCLLWCGFVGRGGYGQIRDGKRLRIASRVAHELFIGPIPDGLIVCHTCDNPRCVEPAHLFLGTNKDNHDDSKAKGRASDIAGELNPNAKLTAAQVLEILESREASHMKLAIKYGVYPTTIKNIKNGSAWRKAREGAGE